jgi:hypothetical protein
MITTRRRCRSYFLTIDKSNTFTCVDYITYLDQYMCRMPKLSVCMIFAHDVGMRSVFVVWVPMAHRLCWGQKPPATMVDQFFVPITLHEEGYSGLREKKGYRTILIFT